MKVEAFTVYIEKTARMLRKESGRSSRRRTTKVDPSTALSLSNKIEQLARFLRQEKRRDSIICPQKVSPQFRDGDDDKRSLAPRPCRSPIGTRAPSEPP